MKDFKSYSKEPEKNNNAADGQKVDQGAQQTINMAQTLAKAFSGKSEKDVWQTILAQAEQGKRDGSLTNADLDNFYNVLSPMLDGFKKQKLKSIIAKLKAI